MVAIVNGYVCFSTCDAKSAQQGKDPNAPPGSAPGVKAHKPGDPPTSSLDGQPATTFGGALQDLANAVTPAGASQQTNGSWQQAVDRYA